MSSKSREQPTYQLIKLRLKFVIGVDKLPPLKRPDFEPIKAGLIDPKSKISNVVDPTIGAALWHNWVHHAVVLCETKQKQSVCGGIKVNTLKYLYFRKIWSENVTK